MCLDLSPINRRFSALPGGRRKRVVTRQIYLSYNFLPQHDHNSLPILSTTHQFNSITMTTPSLDISPLSKVKAFIHEHPKEHATTAARIYNVRPNSIRVALFRERHHQGSKQHGGQNKILSDIQVEAIYKYMEDSYLSGFGATKAMVYAAVGCLKANQLLPKDPPSWRWFQTFMKDHPELFRTIKTNLLHEYGSLLQIEKKLRSGFMGFKPSVKSMISSLGMS